MKKQVLVSLAALLIAFNASATGGQSSGQQASSDQQAGVSDQQSSTDVGGIHATKKDEQSGVSGSQSQSQDQSGMQQSGTQTTSSQSQDQSKGMWSKDVAVNEMALNRLHHVNQKEIELARLAQDKAQSQELKTSAQQIMKDHQALETRVQEVAKSQNVKLQDFQPSTFEKAFMDRLKELSGSQFDQAFMQNMMMGHQEVAQDLRLARNDVQNSQVRQLIDQAIPRIQQHRQMAAKQHKNIQSSGQTSGQSTGAESQAPTS